MRYYLHRDGETHGPYLLQQMHEFISLGEIGPRELVCEEGSSNWIPASQFTLGTTTQLRPGGPSAKAHAEGARVLRVTRDEVMAAHGRLMAPLLGMAVSLVLPLLPWVVNLSALGGHEAWSRYALLGGLGVIPCGAWLVKRFKQARSLRAELVRTRH